MNLPEENSNLHLINTAFQDNVVKHIKLLFANSSSVVILCDFPSQVFDLAIRCQIFGLGDVPFFLNNAIMENNSDIIVITQQFRILHKISFPPFPLPRNFSLFTRSSSSAPDELKLIEIITSLPPNSFPKVVSFCYYLPFQSV